MIDPKDVTPGLWYVSREPPLRPWTVIEVDDRGRTFGIGDEQYFDKSEGETFLGPVPAPAADYRNLLKRYMRHVMNEEGIAFLPSTSGRTRGGAPTVPFTAEEIAALEAIQAEAADDEAREGSA